MLGKQGEIIVAGVKLMLAAGIPSMKPSFANIVRYIKKVKLMSASSLLEEGTHPCSARRRVRREMVVPHGVV